MRAAIYARISQDGGTALGVARQEKDCRALCATRGWTVAEVIVDNDTSAYKGARKGYQHLLDLIDAGDIDALVVWHPDRLHRSPTELEHFIDLVERTGLQVATCTAGDYDLATPDGRLTARIVGSVARKESEDKSRRLRRKHLELAENGMVSGGGRRPFGYEADKLTIRPDEAALIREAADRILAGESLRGVTLDWQRRGIPTVTGAAWQPTTLKRLLTSARISGQREHQGRRYPARWPAIIDPDETIRLSAALTRPTVMVAPRSYLLSGLVACGRCQAPMTTGAVLRKGHRYPRYVCRADRGGCGRCGIGAEPLEEHVSEAALSVLTSPLPIEHRPVLVDVNAVESIEARMATLAEMFAAGEIGRAEWATARAALDERLQTAREALARTDRQAAADRWRNPAVRDMWPTMGLHQRRAVLDSIVERIVIAPTSKATNFFDPSRVRIDWST